VQAAQMSQAAGFVASAGRLDYAHLQRQPAQVLVGIRHVLTGPRQHAVPLAVLPQHARVIRRGRRVWE
jgi:hypothetical protein